jgi:putative nucleotidyltransferase with HDIG domain
VNTTQRARIAEEIVRRLAAAVRGAQLYAPDHPIVRRNGTAFADTLTIALAAHPTVTIGIVDDDLVVGDSPVPRAAETMGELMRRLQQAGIERIAIDAGVELDEITELVQTVARAERGNADDALGARLRHIRVGKLQVEQRVESPGDMATFRQLYDNAVGIAERLWDSTSTEGKPDADAANGIVDSLAQAVAQNRTALMALTALRNYDNYTFTHMVNVSILAMGQARGLGMEGLPLRQIGLAALMHDIGKVKTPIDILNKPGQLTDKEFDILKRHTVDGAAILRQTPDVPALAPVVAFEHHLRADGTGYPNGVSRPTLNVATMLCGIADVYDAMRSQRVYQQSFPTDRILVVLQRNDGKQFDQNLVRRFIQLVGIYPAGNLVRLDTGETAVVMKTYAPDPYRPRVKVLFANDRTPLHRPYEINLWEGHEGLADSIQAPVDPTEYGIDPLTHL